MIWFECKQCHKKIDRPDNAAGSLIFCTCGANLRVPWASTVEPDPQPQPLPRQARPPRPARPVLHDDRDGGDAEPLPTRRPVRIPRKVNPAFCWNHDEQAATGKCADCNLPLCAACSITLQGETLCGPCKNFRIAGLVRPMRLLPLAIIALVVACVSGPVAFVLTLFAIGLQASGGMAAGAVLLCLFSLALPVIGLVLAVMALRKINASPEVAGRGMASGGACAALASGLWTLLVTLLIIIKASVG